MSIEELIKEAYKAGFNKTLTEFTQKVWVETLEVHADEHTKVALNNVYDSYESLRTLEITHCDDIATCADGCCHSEGYHFRCNGKHRIFITDIDKEVLKDIIKFVSPGVKII